MRLAVWGSGKFGSRFIESVCRSYMGEDISITGIYDRAKQGMTDQTTGLIAKDPGMILRDYEHGLFDRVFVAIYDRLERGNVNSKLASLGVPVFIPGDAEDFAGADAFAHADDPDISIDQDGYQLHILEGVRGAVSICNRYEAMYLFSEKGKILTENWDLYSDFESEQRFFYPFRLKDPVPEKMDLKGSWCVLAGKYGPNIWHFIFECADKVYLLEQAGFKGKYLISDSEYGKTVLELMGIGPERIVSVAEFELLKVYGFERLYYPVLEENDRKKSAEPIARMAKKIKAALSVSEELPKEIYIKRVGTRKLIGGEDAAQKLGMEIFVPEEHGALEQIKYFFNADIVLCPNGANSTNSIFMREGTVFIEAFGDRWHGDLNEEALKAAGIIHMQIEGPNVDRGASSCGVTAAAETDDPYWMYDDYMIPEDDIVRAVIDARTIIED